MSGFDTGFFARGTRQDFMKTLGFIYCFYIYFFEYLSSCVCLVGKVTIESAKNETKY